MYYTLAKLTDCRVEAVGQLLIRTLTHKLPISKLISRAFNNLVIQLTYFLG